MARAHSLHRPVQERRQCRQQPEHLPSPANRRRLRDACLPVPGMPRVAAARPSASPCSARSIVLRNQISLLIEKIYPKSLLNCTHVRLNRYRDIGRYAATEHSSGVPTDGLCDCHQIVLFLATKEYKDKPDSAVLFENLACKISRQKVLRARPS